MAKTIPLYNELTGGGVIEFQGFFGKHLLETCEREACA